MRPLLTVTVLVLLISAPPPYLQPPRPTAR